MQSTVVGGAMLPHAPQFFTLPDTEDKDTVARVKKVARDEGERTAFIADPETYDGRFDLAAEQRALLVALDTKALVATGVHPLVPFLARMHLEREGFKA